ncbi:hypothetical protein KHM83_09315 [Fusibacter paucivorans]|uniref:KTSC domain-containing protein n=1 Tax=Fusibacter paucivorans TaxID=76009 RepID=A0ABS5PNY1_9FIRM|nr:hypothetical protein [Fusibacter paucivorans]MBS7526875.1 hypothetical protein [Fusibacter paucivorans]
MRKTERVLMQHPYTANAAIFYDPPHQERVFLRIEMQNAVHYLGTSRPWNLRVNMMLEYAKLSSKQIIA